MKAPPKKNKNKKQSSLHASLQKATNFWGMGEPNFDFSRYIYYSAHKHKLTINSSLLRVKCWP